MLCIEDAQCNAFSYDSTHSRVDNCWLKTKTGAFNVLSGIITGVMADYGPLSAIPSRPADAIWPPVGSDCNNFILPNSPIFLSNFEKDFESGKFDAAKLNIGKIGKEYQLKFKVYPYEIVPSGWSNVLRIFNDESGVLPDDDCETEVARYPGIFINAGTFKMTIGLCYNGIVNYHVNMTSSPLPTRVWTEISITNRLNGDDKYELKVQVGSEEMLNGENSNVHVMENMQMGLDGYGFPPAGLKIRDVLFLSSEWSNWNSWSECDKTCNGGTKFRIRQCLDRLCEGNSVQSAECNPCPCVGSFEWVEIYSMTSPSSKMSDCTADNCNIKDGHNFINFEKLKVFGTKQAHKRPSKFIRTQFHIEIFLVIIFSINLGLEK